MLVVASPRLTLQELHPTQGLCMCLVLAQQQQEQVACQLPVKTLPRMLLLVAEQ